MFSATLMGLHCTLMKTLWDAIIDPGARAWGEKTLVLSKGHATRLGESRFAGKRRHAVFHQGFERNAITAGDRLAGEMGLHIRPPFAPHRSGQPFIAFQPQNSLGERFSVLRFDA